MELKVKEDSVRLITTGKVILHLLPHTWDEFEKTKRGELFVLIKNGPCKCAAIVETVEADNTDPGIMMDSHLRTSLKTQKGRRVQVESIVPSEAVKINLLISTGWEVRPEHLRNRIQNRTVIVGQHIVIPLPSADVQTIKILKTEPPGVVVICPNTRLEFFSQPKTESASGVTFNSIGGLSNELTRIREVVEDPFRFSATFEYLGIEPSRGVILYGPPGTGKTLIARALTNELGANFYLIQGPEIVSGVLGGSEQRLREIFEKARKNPPAVILIDELDAIAPVRGQTRDDATHRLVAALLTLMDGLSVLRDVVVIGTTNRRDAIDPALRRPGRFENEIEIGIPNREARLEILRIFTKRMPLEGEIDLPTIAQKLHGFVGADIASLCREAAYTALRRKFSRQQFEAGQIPDTPDLRISRKDFEAAAVRIRPSAMREVEVTTPKDISLASIGGLDQVKRLLRDNVILPLQNPERFSRAGIKPAKGILFYGPPGTGKTLIARALANECEVNLILIKGPAVLSKWLGESEERIRNLFRKLRDVAPAILLLDEIDAIHTSHLTESIVSQLITEMDDIQYLDNVFVVGTTSDPKRLDPSLMMPGRFDYQIEVPLPDEKGRREIFSIHLKGKPVAKDVSIKKLASATLNFSGADIAEICRHATFEALRGEDDKSREGEDDKSREVVVTMSHLEIALKQLIDRQEKLRGRKIGFGQEQEGGSLK